MPESDAAKPRRSIRSFVLRQGRATGMRATQALMNSYAAMVSGVLIGMSEGLGGVSPEPAAETPARTKTAAAKTPRRK